MKELLLKPIRFVAQKLYVRYKRYQKKHSVTTPEPESTTASPPQSTPTHPKPVQKEDVTEHNSVERPIETPSEEAVIEQLAPLSSIEVEFSDTPNPNACKYDVSTTVSSESFSFSQQEKSKDHPLAHAILSIEGIESVFGVHTFITVTKSPHKNWTELHPKVISTLQKILS